MKMLAARLTVSMGLCATSGTLLYLYFAGSWYDPAKWIEYSEIAFLFLSIILAAWLFIKEVKIEWLKSKKPASNSGSIGSR